jgi:hypothetical protein
MSFAEGGIAVSLVLPLAIGLVLPPGSEDRKNGNEPCN